jgi:hypothetical protein
LETVNCWEHGRKEEISKESLIEFTQDTLRPTNPPSLPAVDKRSVGMGDMETPDPGDTGYNNKK